MNYCRWNDSGFHANIISNLPDEKQTKKKKKDHLISVKFTFFYHCLKLLQKKNPFIFHNIHDISKIHCSKIFISK